MTVFVFGLDPFQKASFVLIENKINNSVQIEKKNQEVWTCPSPKCLLKAIKIKSKILETSPNTRQTKISLVKFWCFGFLISFLLTLSFEREIRGRSVIRSERIICSPNIGLKGKIRDIRPIVKKLPNEELRVALRYLFIFSYIPRPFKTPIIKLSRSFEVIIMSAVSLAIEEEVSTTIPI
jgi:hypothetical protein